MVFLYERQYLLLVLTVPHKGSNRPLLSALSHFKENQMQTIRIYAKQGGLVAKFTGIAGKVETDQMRQQFPESHFNWLR